MEYFFFTSPLLQPEAYIKSYKLNFDYLCSYTVNMASVASAPTTGFNSQPPSGLKGEPQPGLLFDVFYEELLTQLMESGELQEKIPTEFMQLQSDLQRVEYLIQLRPIVRDFRIKSKQTKSLKSLEKSTKHREEGNKLFQNEKTAQAILIYNKSLSLAPHPTVEQYLHPEQEIEKHTPVRNAKFVAKG